MKYGLEFAGEKRRVRRDWRGTLLTALTLLMLVALVAWMWSVVSRCSMLDAGCWILGSSNEHLVAFAGTPSEAFVKVLTVLIMAGAFWWAVLAVRQNERWIEAERQRRIDAAAADLREAEAVVRGEDLRRIVGALIVETCSARDDVRKAQGDLSVEDYGAKLAAAEASLHLVIGCLSGLIESMKDEGEMMKNEEVRL
jgi:hypothetical protein